MMADTNFKIRKSFLLLKEAFKKWNENDPWRNSAVIAYYSILSLPALLVIVINVVGTLFGEEAMKHEISSQIANLIGDQTANDIEQMIANASQSKGSLGATIFGIATLIFGATGVFYQLQQSLNKIWNIKPEPKKEYVKFIKDRIFSFGMIMVIGFLLLISLLISAAIAVLKKWILSFMPYYAIYLFRGIDFLVSIGIITILFAIMFKVLPDAKIRWKDVWVGALVTSLLFVIGKFLLGLYFGTMDPASTYGAASSVILILLWVSYSSLIFFFGAEFTQVYAKNYGTQIRPSDHAVRIKISKVEDKKAR